MPYRYLEDIAIADIAFEASADTLEGLFIASSEALMNVMVEGLNTIFEKEYREIHIEAENPDMLLFGLLQELIYFKDAEQLFLRISELNILKQEEYYLLFAKAFGEKINPKKHPLNVDVKAVTMHRFGIKQINEKWQATVVLDI